MADYYVDPSDGGTDSGTQANPWQDLQSAADTAVAGDRVFCRNTQTLTATIDFDTNSGDTTSGKIRYIGCPTDSWTPDGTTFKLDGNDAATNCINATVSRIWWENFEMYDATSDGFSSSSAVDYCIFINCLSYSHGGHGFEIPGNFNYLERCIAHTNASSGFFYNFGGADNVYHLCVAYGNTANGFDIPGTTTHAIRCIAHDNGSSGDWGIRIDLASKAINCIADGEVSGIQLADVAAAAIACRITNNTTGLDITASGDDGHYGYNLFYNNTTDISDSSVGTYVIDQTSDTNDTTDGDADDGYNNRTNDDFNLKASRTYNGDGTDTVGLGIGS